MSARILVADDSVTIQKVVELTFSKEDFTLIQARSGEEALRKAKEVRPDLILLDLVMPDKNGYDVCIALRADPMLRTVPIILLAGTFESFDQQRGTQAGANDFVTKPFESQVLIGKVKQLIAEDPATALTLSTEALELAQRTGERPLFVPFVVVDRTWNGVGNWTNAANWTPSGAPSLIDANVNAMLVARNTAVSNVTVARLSR